MKIHPCSKEFQEEAKKLGLTGNELIQKYIREGKLRNPKDIDKETNDSIYKRAGYQNFSHYLREWRHDNGIQDPLSDNKNCAHYLGTFVGERENGRPILTDMFGEIEKEMPYGNPSFDFIVKGGLKIDIKSCCLRTLNGWTGWEPHVRSSGADYFVILGFDDRIKLNLLHVWCIHKNEIIRGYEFYKRDSIKITNKYKYLLEFKRFDWIDRLNCLKKI